MAQPLSVEPLSRSVLDTVEELAARNDWSFERLGDDEITLPVKGSRTDYELSFTWRDDIEAIHLACAFEMNVPEGRLAEAQRLVSLINEQLWVGHFDLWHQDGLVMFRHALMLSGGLHASEEQCQALLAAGLDACERYLPSFHYVVVEGHTARESINANALDVAGQA